MTNESALTRSDRDAWGDLMRAAIAGDEAAYRRLLTELAGALRGTVRRVFARAGRRELDVEDAVQEILLAVHLKRHTWDPALPFAPWVLSVARHKAVDALRRSGGAVRVPIDDFEDAIEAPPQADVERIDLARLMGRLDGRQRRIVQAVCVEGRSARDVGAELNMKEGAVRVALHRCLKTLAALYRSDGR